MDLYNEIEFENEICEHLAAHDWLYAEEDAADGMSLQSGNLKANQRVAS